MSKSYFLEQNTTSICDLELPFPSRQHRTREDHKLTTKWHASMGILVRNVPKMHPPEIAKNHGGYPYFFGGFWGSRFWLADFSKFWRFRKNWKSVIFSSSKLFKDVLSDKKSQFSKMLIFFQKCLILVNLQWQMEIFGGPGIRWRVAPSNFVTD